MRSDGCSWAGWGAREEEEEEGYLDLWLLIRNQYNSYSLIKESVTIFVGLWLVLRYIGNFVLTLIPIEPGR